jgi:hypothetical protein
MTGTPSLQPILPTGPAAGAGWDGDRSATTTTAAAAAAAA